VSDRSLYLVLFVLTWALHAVFVGYVVAGTGFALVRRASPLAEQVRDRLPFMLGCGITAGVAPLLFIQLLHQRRFYTANLLLGPRWILVVPALIAGFYALYLAKSSPRWRLPALAGALVAFAFVAYSWSELHELMAADDRWRAFYEAGHRVYTTVEIPLRAAMFLAGAVALFATVSAWSADAATRSRLALGAIGGIAVSAIAGGVLASRATHDVAAGGWLYLLIAGALAAVAGWVWTWRAPARGGLTLATTATTVALIAAAVVREAPRLTLIETSDNASAAGGFAVFALTIGIGIAAIAWIVRTVRA
jgi:hypothetical protein